MLIIPTYLSVSGIHGIGLFTSVNLKQGQVVSIVDLNYDMCWDDLPIGLVGEYVKHYGYKENNKWWLDFDNQRFMNYSDSPNLTSSNTSLEVVALRDIRKDEELTLDYHLWS